MSLTVNGIEYLNTNESAEFLDMSLVTFGKYREQYHLQSYTMPGKGNSKFYKKEDLQQFRGIQPQPREG